MDILKTNPIDLSAEAFLELEELSQGQRPDAPAFIELCRFIRTPTPAYRGQDGISMLVDVRSYALLRDSLGIARKRISDFKEFRKIFDNYLTDLETGVLARKKDKISEAKRFSVSLNENLLLSEMANIYERHERAEMRHVNHESVSQF